LDELVIQKFNLNASAADLKPLEEIIHKIKSPEQTVEIAICGKYTQLHDAYKSIVEAFAHAGVANNAGVKMRWVDSEEIESEGAKKLLAGIHGILVPYGFGHRGIEGKLLAIRYARGNKIPFLGICLGMQCAVIEFARNVCGIKNANSSEFNPGVSDPVIDIMEAQKAIQQKGGTMRLGTYPCVTAKQTLTRKIYESEIIIERHRHRYELNNDYRRILQEHGMILSGLSPDGNLVEMIELGDHPFFIGCQFHPELKSRIMRPHPIFRNFVKAGLDFEKGQK
jgi:CTP synthase